MRECGPIAWTQASLKKLFQHGNGFLKNFIVAKQKQKNPHDLKYFLSKCWEHQGGEIWENLCTELRCFLFSFQAFGLVVADGLISNASPKVLANSPKDIRLDTEVGNDWLLCILNSRI